VILKDVCAGTVTDIEPEKVPDISDSKIKFEHATVLIADDIDANRDLLKGFLADFDFHIIECGNGKQAVDLTERCDPDLILMDIKMPVMDGYEASRIIRNREMQRQPVRHIPIIAVTASVLQENDNLIKSAGCDSILRKPVSKKELITELIRFLPYSKEIPVSSSLTVDSALRSEPQFSLQSLSPETRAKIPNLTNILRNEMKTIRDRLMKTFIFNEIEEFADQIKGLGTAYKLDVLTAWGDNLLKQARNFDMENLPKTLNHFTDLVNEIAGINADQV
jgi:two-component system sensor histidine kinase EvgS